MSHDVDLADLARAYRYRPPTPATIQRARAAVDDVSRGDGWCLDVGGGPGDHAATWAPLGFRPVVVDPSAEMVATADRAHGSTVAIVRAEAESLPFSDGVASLVYVHLALHHMRWPEAVREFARVTARGARIELWTFDPDAMPRSALGRWFPSIGPIDAARFPPVSQVAALLEAETSHVEVDACPEQVVRTAGSWVEAVENRFVSTIQLIGEDELRSGLDRFRSAYPNPDQPYHYTIEFTRIRAVR